MKRNYVAKKLMVSILTASVILCYPLSASASEIPDNGTADPETEIPAETPDTTDVPEASVIPDIPDTTDTPEPPATVPEANTDDPILVPEYPNTISEDVPADSMPDAAIDEATQDPAENPEPETFEGIWKKSNGKWWFQTTDGGYLANNIYTIAGKNYAFDATGWMVVGWYKQTYEDQSFDWFYFNNSGAMTYGWQKVNQKWYYLDPEEGFMYSDGLFELDHTYYYLLSSGAMHTGWHKEIFEDGSFSWYYFNTNGSMAYGWQKVKGKWYYLNPTYGNMYSSGLFEIDGVSYYLNKDGDMHTGWHKEIFENGSFDWYYFTGSGAMAHGWQKINQKWYYLDPEYGYMHTQWVKVDNIWYYLNPNGDMVTGWKKIDNIWYYFTSSGAMQTNKWIGNYYVEEDGSMATNKWIGKYYVGADGCWIKLNANETVMVIDNGNGTSVQLIGTIDNAMSNEIFRQLNAYRASKGLPQLKQANSQLQDAVNLRSAECAVKFSHERPNGQNCFSVYSGSCAENIIYGTSLNASQAMDAWKKSSGHNANMLTENATSVGIGTFRLRNGYIYCVQLFSND